MKSANTISPKLDCPIKGRSIRKRGVDEGETQNNKKIRERNLSPENLKIIVNSLVKKKLERRNAFKKHTKDSGLFIFIYFVNNNKCYICCCLCF